MTTELDIDRFDRQNRTFGINGTQQINKSSICIIGCAGGLATEICKNLALSGIKLLSLYDLDSKNNLITESDLVTGYYYTKKDIGKKRTTILKDKLFELNNMVKINIINNDDLVILNDIIVVINLDENNIIKYNNLSRQYNLKFISLSSNNFHGHIFVDAGDEYIIEQVSSENYEPLQLLGIDKNGIINSNEHEYQNGDLINFYNFQGENLEYFLNKIWEIEVINKFSFKLINFDMKENFNFINGTANYIHKSIKLNHNSFVNIIKPDKLEYIPNKIIEYIPMVSIMGSLVASECIKLITHKFMPIDQWFSWDDEYLDTLDFKELKNKIEKSKWLIVGSGAIGCELLKNLAWLNVHTIHVTDPDTIEKSNLSRQFLFRSDDIGKLKSQVATKKILESKDNIIMKYYSEKVDWNNKIFTDQILSDDELTGVFNALDNITARKFMDEQCFNYDKPLFESGTLGTKGNTQPIIPYLTETYSNSNDPPHEKSYPVCTIKSFPNQIYHTIHWALDQFEFFNRGVSNLEAWINNKNMIFENTTNGTQAKDDVYLFTDKYQINKWEDSVIWAMDMFYENYNEQINKLLTSFPPDLLTPENTLFWSGGKKCPQPLEFNINNELHINYIDATVKLLCSCISVESNFKIDELLIEILKYNKINIRVLENKNTNITYTKINPQILNKDNEYHMNWITGASNLRALNYSIPTEDLYITKGIAGKIIPAISTTTSIIGGLITLEMIKYLSNNKNINIFKSTFINLADNMIISAEPITASFKRIGSMNLNVWFKFQYDKDSTLNEFKVFYENLFNSKINMIAYNSCLLYSDFIDNNNLNKKFSEIKEIDNTNHIEITLLFEDETIDLPPILVKIKK